MKNLKLNVRNGNIKIDLEKNIIEIKEGDIEILLNHPMQIRTSKSTPVKNAQYTQKSLFDDIEHVPGELNCDYENSHDKRKRVITGQYVGRKQQLIKDTVILKEFDTFLNAHFNTKTFDFKIRIRRPYGEINEDGKQDYTDQIVRVMGVELYDKETNQFKVTLIESYNDSIGLKVVRAPVNKIKQLSTIDNIEKFGPYPTLTFRRTTKGKGPEKTKIRVKTFLESLLKGYLPTGKVLRYKPNKDSHSNARFIEFKDNTNAFFYMPVYGYGYRSWLTSLVTLPNIITSSTYKSIKKIESPLKEKQDSKK